MVLIMIIVVIVIRARFKFLSFEMCFSSYPRGLRN